MIHRPLPKLRRFENRGVGAESSETSGWLGYVVTFLGGAYVGVWFGNYIGYKSGKRVMEIRYGKRSALD